MTAAVPIQAAAPPANYHNASGKSATHSIQSAIFWHSAFVLFNTNTGAVWWI